MGDLADRAYTVLLCELCAPKFDARKHRYRRVRSYRIAAKCDGCREFRCGDAVCFHHESLIGTHPGSVIDPRRV